MTLPWFLSFCCFCTRSSRLEIVLRQHGKDFFVRPGNSIECNYKFSSPCISSGCFDLYFPERSTSQDENSPGVLTSQVKRNEAAPCYRQRNHNQKRMVKIVKFPAEKNLSLKLHVFSPPNPTGRFEYLTKHESTLRNIPNRERGFRAINTDHITE